MLDSKIKESILELKDTYDNFERGRFGKEHAETLIKVAALNIVNRINTKITLEGKEIRSVKVLKTKYSR